MTADCLICQHFTQIPQGIDIELSRGKRGKDIDELKANKLPLFISRSKCWLPLRHSTLVKLFMQKDLWQSIAYIHCTQTYFAAGQSHLYVFDKCNFGFSLALSNNHQNKHLKGITVFNDSPYLTFEISILIYWNACVHSWTLILNVSYINFYKVLKSPFFSPFIC